MNAQSQKIWLSRTFTPLSEYFVIQDRSLAAELTEDKGLSGEFLYSWARMLDPKDILLTGSSDGIYAAYLAQALKDNNSRGRLTVCVADKPSITRIKLRVKSLYLERYVDTDREIPNEYFLEYPCKMMVFAGEPYMAYRELNRFEPELIPGGYAFTTNVTLYSQEDEATMPIQLRQKLHDEKLRVVPVQDQYKITGYYKPKKDLWIGKVM